MFRYLLVVFILATLAPSVQAQVRPQYSQYPMNLYLINPAVAGIEQYTDVRVGNRSQWSQLEGAPTTSYLSIHGSLDYSNPTVPAMPRTTNPAQRHQAYKRKINENRPVSPHHGVGGLVAVDRIGPYQRIQTNLSYAIHVPLSTLTTLSAGVSGGLFQNALDQSRVHLVNPNDQALTNGSWRDYRWDINAGLCLYSQRYFVGASMAQFLGGAFSFLDETERSYEINAFHYYLTAGYRLEATPQVSFIPTVLVRFYTPAAPSVDVTMMANFIDRVWAGLSYRSDQTVVALTRFSVTYLLDVGYSFDYNASRQIGPLSHGNHEITLGLRLYNRRKVLRPSYFW